MKTNGVTRKTFETSKFMSSDFVAKPYNPMDLMDDHVKSVPALPVTSFFSDETYNLQSRPRANSMEMESKLAPPKPVAITKEKTWEEKYLMDNDSDGSTRDADEGFGEESITYNGQETKSVELSAILSKHKHSSRVFLRTCIRC